MVPRLTTALTGPLLDLERRILERMPDIERWLRIEWQEHAVPFYASVDLRNAGFKLAPIDTNLFPGGFNNLNAAFLPLCVQAVQTAVERVCPDARGVLLVPENHTRNTFYLQNVCTLVGILRQAGMRVRIGSLSDEVKAPTRIELARRRNRCCTNRSCVAGVASAWRTSIRAWCCSTTTCRRGGPRSSTASTSRSRRRYPPAGTTAASRTISRYTAAWRNSSASSLTSTRGWSTRPSRSAER